MSTSLNDGEAVKKPYVINAFLDGEKTVLARLSSPLKLPYDARDVTVMDVVTGNIFPTVAVESAAQPGSGQADLVRILLADAPDVTGQLRLGLNGYGPHALIPRNVLNTAGYTYGGDDLGNVYTGQATAFRLWAPTASAVQLLLYDSEDGPLVTVVEMQRAEQGTWYVRVEEDLADWYYLYQVTVRGSTQIAVDPYVKAMAVNATRGMIVDLQRTDPPGWGDDRPVVLENAVDAVIYETHVRDFSIAGNSGMQYRGKYLAFTERGTSGPAQVATGVDSLKELGVTHVQVMPVADFASVDENEPGQYNWGYDPRNYHVPEGAYATTPHGAARIIEYKRMIESLHRAGLGVVMDVVYNHTFATRVSDFDKVVPLYYYRTDDAGNYSNGSGVGNEIATERPMVQKFVCDSLAYWVREYHVDGFRFDLMALLGVDTMRRVAQELREINEHMLLYGEPWAGGASALPEDQLLTRGKQQGMGVGIFNDALRNGLIGSVFDPGVQGFVTGASGQVETMKKGVAGSVHDFAAAPGETINYVTSHDNLTLWDKISASTPGASEQDRIKMDKLAQAVVMTAQGVAFMQGGEEFLRSKGGNSNSYNAGDAVNQFDWGRKARYLDVFNYYAGLIQLRVRHPAFRLTNVEQIDQCLTFLNGPDNTVVFLLKKHANGDMWSNIVVVYNPNRAAVMVQLPAGDWTIAVNQQRVDEGGLGRVAGSVSVDGISCMVLYQ